MRRNIVDIPSQLAENTRIGTAILTSYDLLRFLTHHRSLPV